MSASTNIATGTPEGNDDLRAGMHLPLLFQCHRDVAWRAALSHSRRPCSPPQAGRCIRISGRAGLCGAHRELHDITSEYSSFDIPIIVEIIERGERVLSLLAELEPIVSEGLMAASPVQVLPAIPMASERVAREETAPSVAAPRPMAGANRISGEKEASEMKIEGDAKRVTVYIGSNDTWNGRNLAVAIVERCRKMGIAEAERSAEASWVSASSRSFTRRISWASPMTCPCVYKSWIGPRKSSGYCLSSMR